MRSAFAEAYLRHLQASGAVSADIVVGSAGVRAYPLERAEPSARRVAGRLGISLDAHRATRTSRELIAAFQRVYIMDQLNEELLLQDVPEAASKTEYLSVWLPGAPKEIEDPYQKHDRALEECFRTIQQAVERLAASL